MILKNKPNIEGIVAQIDKKDLEGIALMGSYSVGKAKEFSDVDIVLFTRKSRPIETQIVDSKLVVISCLKLSDLEQIFTIPQMASQLIFGLQNMKPLWDPNDFLKQVIQRSKSFEWTTELQAKANKYTSTELVSLIEEVHKGLQCLKTDDIGRGLNCIFGMSYGLGRIIRTQKGILIRSDNALFDQLMEYFHNDPETSTLFKYTFGVKEAIIEKRVQAGLILFEKISTSLYQIMDPSDREKVELTNAKIKKWNRSNALIGN